MIPKPGQMDYSSSLVCGGSLIERGHLLSLFDWVEHKEEISLFLVQKVADAVKLELPDVVSFSGFALRL